LDSQNLVEDLHSKTVLNAKQQNNYQIPKNLKKNQSSMHIYIRDVLHLVAVKIVSEVREMETVKDVQAVIEFVMTWGVAGIIAIAATAIAAVVYGELA
jgi:hypothetical protein